MEIGEASEARSSVTGRAVALLLACVAATSCTVRSSAGPNPVVTDSAGVEVVTNRPGSVEAAEEWSLSDVPVAELGRGGPADSVVRRVSAVTPLPDGRVAVGMNGPPRVLVYAPDGTLAMVVGRQGRGLRGFSFVGSVVPLRSDSLAVWDVNERRMSVITHGGEFARDVDLQELAPRPLAVGAASGIAELLPGSSGSLVLVGIGYFGPEMGAYRQEAPSYRVSSTGEELASYGPFPGIHMYQSRMQGAASLPFGTRTFAASLGETLVVGTGEDPELRLYGPDGSLDRIVRWPDTDRRIGDRFRSRWEALVDSGLAALPDFQRASLREFVADLPRPERVPPYEDVVTSDEGEIWVGEYPGPLQILGVTPERLRMPARRWLILDSEGTLVGSLRTPEGFQLHAVRDGLVWGVYEDERRVESVRAYAVVRD